MDVSFLLRGFLIGLSIAAPVGPMAVLCIQRTLDKGRLYGLISDLASRRPIRRMDSLPDLA